MDVEHRHADRGTPLARFASRILVVCPRCGGRAVVVPRPGGGPLRYYSDLLFLPRRLACAGCGATGEWEPERRAGARVGVTLGGPAEPYFGRPLWLQTRCAGRVLWAYDAEHVDALTGYIGARLRERGCTPSSWDMFPRLPDWMTSAAHRETVLAGLAALRTLAGRSAPADRSDAADGSASRASRRRVTY
ncbi:hypothetical protein OKJ48_14210 [Streptomyces kunmingensis]|uniref:TFIIB-type zinc ribbon-containing protein n=1 Tax=Streptomyces kunmingensis TaxID=68225 RepID=A0ABU6C9T7_9ACTN|nr:hypothetical protein [Streptomyces kunmingensis]MEB3961392.1 hypothetical protein [Streptomyces kunmingensis]